MRKPCCDEIDTKKGAWSKQEDQRLIDYITKYGEGSWRILPKAAGLLRCGKSCRLRWINYLRPDLKRGNFEEDEEDLIIKLHALLGNRWSLIAGRLPGRTDNEVKNYWNSHLKRRLINMGIDPNNHNLKQVIAHSKNLSSGPSETTIFSKNSETMKNKSCTNDHVSNDGMLDLNLNLTMAIPSMVVNVDDVKKENESTISMERNESDPPPTLFLFA